VSDLGESVDRSSRPELVAVADAAGTRLRAEIEEDSDAMAAGTDALMGAATSAMSAGCSLGDIARAESLGQEDVRRVLRGDILKRVERTARQARDAEAEHHRAIARAMRLGLSTREIAHSAGVTHGTIRAITNRSAGSTAVASDVAMSEPPSASDAR